MVSIYTFQVTHTHGQYATHTHKSKEVAKNLYLTSISGYSDRFGEHWFGNPSANWAWRHTEKVTDWIPDSKTYSRAFYQDASGASFAKLKSEG